MPWRLDNAEELAAAAPRSFFIPPPEIRHGLVPGDEVKLIFRLEREDGETSVERMWVRVVETDPYAGVLDNDPHLEGVIEAGARVPFGPEHVASYMYDDEQLGYPAGQRCFVSPPVAQQDVAPEALYLDRDGQWWALTGRERPEVSWELGYLTDRFPETAEALREGHRPRGLRRRPARDVWFRREGDRYVRQRS